MSLKADTKVDKSSPCKAESVSSESSSSAEEDRLKRLFESCDADGDGFIDRDDFFSMCGKLSMEESATEIMNEMGMDHTSRITFNDFIRYRSRIMAEMELPHYLDESDRGVHLPHRDPNVSSWPTMSSDNSLGAHSGKPDSLDYDSGARDMSPEPPSFQKLIESHDPSGFHNLQASYSGSENFLDLANRLHLAALTSLKGEIIDLTNRLQHVTCERDLLEKQLNKAQTDKLRLQRECEDRVEQTAARYEERITELHSVIAELRKKIERHHINVIREEDEFEDSDAAASAKSDQDLASLNENNANGSQSASLDMGNELNSELSRVVADLETAIDQRRAFTDNDVVLAASYDNDRFIADPDENVEEKAVQVCRQMEKIHFNPPPPPTSPPPPLNNDFSPSPLNNDYSPPFAHSKGNGIMGASTCLPNVESPPPPALVNRHGGMDIEMSRYLLVPEMDQLRGDNIALQETVVRQEAELNSVRTTLCGTRDERERLKKRVRELQGRLTALEGTPSPQGSRTSTPTKSQLVQPPSADRNTGTCDNFPVAKIAELKKLRTSATDRHVLGSELSAYGLPNAKLAEHLAQSLQECSNMQEIIQTLYKCGSEISESNVKEFEIETERLSSKIDHLKSQNDLLQLTLDESRAHTDRLSVLMGKYESNNTALQLAINYSDQALEAFEVLVTLLESEQGVLLANCRAAGLGSYGEGDDQQEITNILQRSNHARKSAENVAKHLLQRLDRSCGINVHIPACNIQPWEDLSSNGRTGSTTSSTASSGDMEFGKGDETRLREYIQQLKNDRASVKMTVLELESIHVDPLSHEPCGSPDSQRLDLENAVIMQELMAMKEEKAELKAQNYLLDKEKRALELRLSGKESQEQAYRVQIDHLKCEVEQQLESRRRGDPRGKKEEESIKAAMLIVEQHSHNATEIAEDLSESMKRERKLKQRVQELVSTLEKLSRNSERRHQESAEFVNDLKRANSALISAFEKAKKKYQSKLKKLEAQMTAMTERYETQLNLLKERVTLLEQEAARLPANETSL